MVRRYQALGKARISGKRRMSYLNEAEPMSMSVEKRTTALGESTSTKLTLRERDKLNLTNSTLTLSESLRSLSASELRCWSEPSRRPPPPDFLPKSVQKTKQKKKN